MLVSGSHPAFGWTHLNVGACVHQLSMKGTIEIVFLSIDIQVAHFGANDRVILAGTMTWGCGRLLRERTDARTMRSDARSS